MNERTDAKMAELDAEIKRCYPEWQVTNLAVLGMGLDCLVCRADSAPFGQVALRTPWARWDSNPNDELVDGRQLLQREALLAAHLHQHGLPTPAVYALHIGESLDFLASAYLPHDGSPMQRYDCGRLLAALHAAPIPQVPSLLPAPEQTAFLVAERLLRRARVLERYIDRSLPFPPLAEIAALLHAPRAAPAILHMDFRPANLLSNAGEIIGIVDWANALLGDPALELARIAEYGHLDDTFLAGYGSNPLALAPLEVALLYRFDTAVMLALVFLCEAPDPEAAQRQVKRVAELHQLFCAG